MEKIKKILFVDDEKSILKAVKRTFRKSIYTVLLANSADEALEILKNETVNVIISDYMMPDMDGYELLKIVKVKYPDVTRIILSGYSTDKIVFKSLFNGVVKTFITKPWDDDYIKIQLDKTFKVKEILESKELSSYIENLSSLPALPAVYEDLVEAIASDKDIKTIGSIIEKDASISIKLLQTVNSSFYQLKTTTVSKAVIFIGLEAIRDLIITASVFDPNKYDEEQQKYIKLFWEHSQLCNKYLLEIYKFVEGKKIDSNFMSLGLIANIGYLVLLKKNPKKFKILFGKMSIHDKDEYKDFDTSLFQTTHEKIGAYLLNWWNLPYKTLEIILYHHNPYELDSDEINIRKYLHIADLMAWKKLGYLKEMNLAEEYKELIEDFDFDEIDIN